MKYKIKRRVGGFIHEPVLKNNSAKIPKLYKDKPKAKINHKAILIKSFFESVAVLAGLLTSVYLAKFLGLL